MNPYDDLNVYYGDLHNHCGISYGHGSLEDAFKNAREQLDFCSVTGHALWPDMPAPDPKIQYIIDFHKAGFARLREGWESVQAITAAYHEPGTFLTFLSFEMHSGADGDRTILYKGAEGPLLQATGLDDLHTQIRALRASGTGVMAFPHHIGYKQGQRGINWATFDPEFAPVVEIISMHGCSEGDEGPRPFLHSMGPSDHASTWRYGLAQGHIAGVLGSTDHHSGHPGSYGHGRTGLWATAKTRDAIWEALEARRTYALTGDRVVVQFAIDDQPMGSVLSSAGSRRLAYRVVGGAPLDSIDLIKNGELYRRVSRCDVVHDEEDGELVHTKLTLELGWGARGERVDWDVRFGISDGRVIAVEPRFRGPEVVAPQEADETGRAHAHTSHWERQDARTVSLRTVTYGNPNNLTPATQAICLEVEMPVDAEVVAEMNGQTTSYPLAALLAGARAGRLGKIDSPAYRFHRAPRWWELAWEGEFADAASTGDDADVYYLRVRQINDQWAWTSPIWVQP
ncbi:MAG: DUF3604 domain-containing protein [Anaerolineae bacterium]|nr:DUF3604 domain-containing protein [Anaerolineae bacterium]